MRSLLALTLSAAVSSLSPSASVYRLDHPSAGGYCSAFVIDSHRHYLLTADHCVTAYDTPLINGVTAHEIFHEQDLDISVIEAPGLRTGPSLAPAYDTPAYNEKAFALGYAGGKGLKRIDSHVMIRGWRHEAAEGWWVAFGPPQVTEGMSGGPWLDVEGKVIAVIQIRSDKQYNYSVSRKIEDIYPPTKEYWEHPAPVKMRDEPKTEEPTP